MCLHNACYLFKISETNINLKKIYFILEELFYLNSNKFKYGATISSLSVTLQSTSSSNIRTSIITNSIIDNAVIIS